MSLAETLRRLPPAAADFSRSLYDHHGLEASWLYERRDVHRAQGALLSADDWRRLEARADAHVAALAKGGALVLDECEDKAIDGDVGELHTAARLLCRANRPDRLGELLGRIDWQEPARAWAVTDALAWDAPDSWQPSVGAWLVDEATVEGALGPLARAAGMRGWAALGDSVVDVLRRRAGDLEATSWAAGALWAVAGLRELYGVLQEGHAPEVRRAASIAALRFAPREMVAFLQQVVKTEPWAMMPLAISGGSESWGALSEAVKATPTPEGMWAIGLFGDVGGIDLLLEMVEDEECGAAATEGLYVLTGAELHEDEHGEPESDEDESLPLLARRLSRRKEPWSTWLGESRLGAARDAGTRIRLGVAFDPGNALTTIPRPWVDVRLRERILEELCIRYRLRTEAWPRLTQRLLLRKIQREREPIEALSRRSRGWLLAGQRVRVA